MGIYVIDNMKNGNVYVGSSNDIEKRWRKHRERLKRDNHINPHLQSSRNKYGQE